MSRWHDWIDHRTPVGAGSKTPPNGVGPSASTGYQVRGSVYALGQGVWVAACQACPFAKPYDTQDDAYRVAESHARQPHMTHEGKGWSYANPNRVAHR